jgi:hypothetical protein
MKRNGKAVLGDRMYEYRMSRILGGDFPGDNGATVADAVQATIQYGVAPETDWPYDPNGIDDTPPANVAGDAVKDETNNSYLVDSAQGYNQTLVNIQTALAVTGLPVVYGTPVYAQIEDVGSDGIIDMPSGASIGGHCMMFFGYQPGYLWTLNSWGEGWGKAFGSFGGGLGLLPTGYVTTGLVSDCHVIAGESEITPPVTHTTVSSAPTIMSTGNILCVGSDKAVWENQATTTWTSLGGVALSAPAACTDGTNVDVFCVGSDNAIWWKRNATPWKSLGGSVPAGAPPSAAYVNGVLTVAVTGATHAIYEKKYVSGKWPTAWTEVALNLN